VLTETQIVKSTGHDDLLELLFAELRFRIPPGQPFQMGRFLQKIRTMPVGLRAMAATFELDVSITLDGLGWHFGNWTHHGYCDETLRGLRELEAPEYAEMFAKAYELAQSDWNELSNLPPGEFKKWYYKSDLRKQLSCYRDAGGIVRKDGGIFGHWTRYARKYPHKVTKIVRFEGSS
jgi:hypothetical protein